MNCNRVQLTAEPSLTIAIAQIVEELANVNNSNDITTTFEFEPSTSSQINGFEQFYDDLTQIFRRNPGPDTDSETDSPHVPPVIPPNPRHPSSDIASNTSTDTRESGPEHHTNSCAKEFVKASHRCLKKHLKKASWFPEHYRVLSTCYSTEARLIIREKHTMKIRQPNPENNIVAESDGGLIIYPSSSRKCHYPVLIVEVILE